MLPILLHLGQASIPRRPALDIEAEPASPDFDLALEHSDPSWPDFEWDLFGRLQEAIERAR